VDRLFCHFHKEMEMMLNEFLSDSDAIGRTWLYSGKMTAAQADCDPGGDRAATG
jgi:hypothetical protein